MTEQELKWYSTFVFLVGAILSFADPITDILTLVEFYRADHKTWFGVGLTFVILPCLPFACLNSFTNNADAEGRKCFNCVKDFLVGFNPFSAGIARLRAFIFCLKNFKKLWKGQSADGSRSLVILRSSKISAFFEAIFESVPQFIIQLYAMSVQEEPVKIIQMVSLPVSFLSLAWTFTVADQIIDDTSENIEMNIKHKVILFVSHTIQLSSRLFAICFFLVSYKWWIVAILTLHSGALFTVDLAWGVQKDGKEVMLVLPIFFFLYWLRDEFTVALFEVEDEKVRKDQRKRVLWLSNVLFVVENVAMILMFYFSQHSNTWYSLPVTVCVCSLSILGAAVRLIHYSLFLRMTHNDHASEMKAEKPADNSSVQL